MPAFPAVRYHAKSQLFIQICGEYGAFYCTAHYGRGQKESLVKGLHDAKRCADLPAKSRGCQAVRAVFDQRLLSGNVPAYGSQTAARIFDQGTYDHIRAHIARFDCFDKFSVTVVYHTDNIRFDPFDKGDQFSDFMNGIAGTCLIAFGALYGNQLCLFVQRRFDCRIVKISVFQQFHLAVVDAVFCQGTF